MSDDIDPVHDRSRLAYVADVIAATEYSSVEMDEIAIRAAKTLKVPISLVTFVEDHRQVFKGECGLPDTLAALREMPISYSICQYTVRTSLPLIIPDAENHPLLSNHPSVREMGIQAYMGIPLILSGYTIGALSFVDYVPRQWTGHEITQALTLAAEVIERLIDLIAAAPKNRPVVTV